MLRTVDLVRVRTRLLALGAVVLGLLAGSLVAPTGARSAAVEFGYRDFSYSTSITAPTGQKPESKLWYADGTWWGALWNNTIRRMEIHRFNKATQDTDAWTPTGTILDGRRNAEADTLWDGTKLYVLTHMKDTDANATDLGLKFQRFGYSTATKKYTLEASRTVVNKRAEAAVLDKDSSGTLWATYTTENATGGREVRVAHSTTDDTTWTAPYVLPVTGADNLSLDDIATLVAYKDSSSGTRRIGVLWSNESTGSANGLYFASHVDGAGDTAASWAGTRLCADTLCPDDHLNIKSIDADASGNLYAAVKTSKNDATNPNPDDPLIVVYRLNLSGTWTHSTAWQVKDDVTRVIILLDSTNHEAHLFGAGPCCSGGTVYTKSATLGTLAFDAGIGTPFIKSSQDPNINNTTSTKQTVNSSTGLLVLAGDDSTRFYVHNYMTIRGGDTTAPTVAAVSPADGAGGQGVTANVTATFSEAMDPATVNTSTFTLSEGTGTAPVSGAVTLDVAGTTATLDPAASLKAGTVYTARVTGAKDLAGNTVATRTWTFTTAQAVPTSTVTLTATADTYVKSTSPGTSYGTSTTAWVDNSPVEIGYLKFNLAPYAGRTITSAQLKVRTTTSVDSGTGGTVTVRPVADDSWSESTTYTTRKALGTSTLGSLATAGTNTAYSIPLSPSSLQADVGRTLSLGLTTTSSDGLGLTTRETTTPPALQLTLSGSTTDTTAPTVKAVSPADKATGQSVATNVSATFSEAMAPASITGSTMTLTEGATTTRVAGAVTLDATGTTATLNPTANLKAGTSYTARVTGAKDLAGNTVTAKAWTFTTAASPTTVTLTATADTYVNGSSPGSQYGTSTTVWVDNSPVNTGYLKFNLTPYAGRTITAATLKLRTTTSSASGSGGTFTVRPVADDTWSESTTYTTRKALGSTVLGSLAKPASTNTAYSITLTPSALQGDVGSSLSLGLTTTTSDGLGLTSRQTGTPPTLQLTLR